MPTLRVI